MRIGAAFGWAILGGLVIVACGSSSDGGSTGDSCTPAAFVACTGPGGCSGEQVCNQSGNAYGDCQCGAGPDADGSVEGATNDSGNTNQDSGASGWTPKNLSGLELWTEGGIVDVPDATGVSRWPDQSPAADDLTVAGGDPHVHHAAIGGLDALLFSAEANDRLEATPAAFGMDDFVIELVANPGACLGSCNLWSLNSLDLGDCNVQFIATGVKASVRYECSPTPDYTVAPATAGPHVFGFRHISSTAAEIRIDGTATPVTLSGEATAGTSPQFVIGQWDGDLAEIVIAKSPSDADVMQLESYLKLKYGL